MREPISGKTLTHFWVLELIPAPLFRACALVELLSDWRVNHNPQYYKTIRSSNHLHTWLFRFQHLHTFSYICSTVYTCSPRSNPLPPHPPPDYDLIWDSCSGGLSLVFKQTRLSSTLQGPEAGVQLWGPLRVSHPRGEIERRAPV